MKKLKQLSPDPLQDAIVELRFQTNVPRDIIKGSVYSDLTELGFSLLEKPNSSIDVNGKDQILDIVNPVIYHNDFIKLEIRTGSIVFNIVNDYPLWEKYFGEVKKVCEVIKSKGFISSFNRVGVRYINVFYNENIFVLLNDSVTVKFGDKTPQKLRLNSEHIEDGKRIIVNIGNGFIDEEKKLELSMFDIDVIEEGVFSNDEVYKAIEGCHLKEKNVFVSYMSDEFFTNSNAEFL